MRIIEARVTATGADGTRVTGSYRLITTLTGHRTFPATALVRLCHERWEIETAFLALRHTLLGGRVLRSGDRPGAEQELWALLTLYQLLRMAMVTAVETQPGTNPDRASFTTALEAARDQVTAAAGICPHSPGRPARRYRPGRASHAATRPAAPLQRPQDQSPHLPLPGPPRPPALCRNRHHRDRHHHHHPGTGPPPPPHPLHTQKSQATPATHPPPAHHGHHHQPAPRDWTPRELARMLDVHPRPLATQLREWALLGFFTHTGLGTYRLNTPTPPSASTTAPDP